MTATTVAARRKLGSLEVSSIGLGCQTMPGTLYGPEERVLALCEELGIGFVPRAPLAYGFTTGMINPTTRFTRDDFRASVPWFSREPRPGRRLHRGVIR